MFAHWCTIAPTFDLEEVRRFREAWQAKASLLLPQGDPDAAAIYAEHIGCGGWPRSRPIKPRGLWIDPQAGPRAALRHHCRARTARRCRPDRYRALVLTAGLAGLREGELLALRWDDLDLTDA